MPVLTKQNWGNICTDQTKDWGNIHMDIPVSQNRRLRAYQMYISVLTKQMTEDISNVYLSAYQTEG